MTECVGEDDIRKLNTTKQEIEKRRILVQLLDKIHNDFEQGRISFEEKGNFINLLREQAEAQYTIDAYRHSCISPWQYNHVIQRLWTLWT